MKNKKNKQTETLIWEGQNDFITFVHVVKTIGYKYVILCIPKKNDKRLGAACLSDEELIATLIEFSDMGFSCKVARVEKWTFLNENS